MFLIVCLHLDQFPDYISDILSQAFKNLRQGNSILYCTGPTDLKFQQIKIILTLISLFFFTVYFCSNMILFFYVTIKKIKNENLVIVTPLDDRVRRCVHFHR